MQKKYGILAKKVAISSLIVIISIGGFSNDDCDPKPVPPETIIPNCTLEIVNYWPDKDGNLKPPKIVTGPAKAGQDGKCPPTKITTEPQ
jgi:hypothetical protein